MAVAERLQLNFDVATQSGTLCCTIPVAVVIAGAMLHGGQAATGTAEALSCVQRFLSGDHEPLRQYRALRHLTASAGKLKKEGWLDAWTELDLGEFRYEIVAEGGSEHVRNKVLKAALKREQSAWNSGQAARSTVSTANYDFEQATGEPGSLMKVIVKPRRNEDFLIDGAIFLTRDEGDLVRVEGRLAKSPSFWISRVRVVRTYDRIGGVRVPVRTESVADVKLLGASSFEMTYEYETVNDRPVGSPAVIARGGRS